MDLAQEVSSQQAEALENIQRARVDDPEVAEILSGRSQANMDFLEGTGDD